MMTCASKRRQRISTFISILWFLIWGFVVLLYLHEFPITSIIIFLIVVAVVELGFGLVGFPDKMSLNGTGTEWIGAIIIILLLTVFFYRLYSAESALSKRLYDPYLAVKASDVNTLKTLLDGFDIDMKGNNGATPLHAAAGSGRIDSILFLLHRGADINAQNYDGETPQTISHYMIF